MDKDKYRETEAYLAHIRKTIAESNRLVEQADLRIRETDRLLESQGLTREQVLNFRFTDAQRAAVNEELKRRGMEPLEDLPADARPAADEAPPALSPSPDAAGSGEELENRRRKLGMMMKPFQI